MEDSPECLVSQNRGGSSEFLWEYKLTAREAHILGMVSASTFVFLFRILSVLLVLIIVPQRAMNTRSAYMATISFYLLNSDVSNISHFFSSISVWHCFLSHHFPSDTQYCRHMSKAKIFTNSWDCFVAGVSQMFYCLAIKSFAIFDPCSCPLKDNKQVITVQQLKTNELS